MSLKKILTLGMFLFCSVWLVACSSEYDLDKSDSMVEYSIQQAVELMIDEEEYKVYDEDDTLEVRIYSSYELSDLRYEVLKEFRVSLTEQESLEFAAACMMLNIVDRVYPAYKHEGWDSEFKQIKVTVESKDGEEYSITVNSKYFKVLDVNGYGDNYYYSAGVHWMSSEYPEYYEAVSWYAE